MVSISAYQEKQKAQKKISSGLFYRAVLQLPGYLTCLQYRDSRYLTREHDYFDVTIGMGVSSTSSRLSS